jgi:hypothetical protein
VSYVLFVSSPAGYTLREIDGDPPHLGEELDDNGHTLVVNKLGSSPLPGDSRTCAFTVGKG